MRWKVWHQPYIAVVTLVIGLVVVMAAVAQQHATITAFAQDRGVVFLPAMTCIVMLSYRYPIYVRHNIKITVVTVPLYLMCVLLPPPVAALAAACGIAVGELSVRSQRGTYLCDVVTIAGRWLTVMLLASTIAHVPFGDDNFVLALVPLAGAALTMWAGDLLSLPLMLTPISGERPLPLILGALREGSAIEGVQYVVGLAGTAAMEWQPWTLILIILPTVLVYMACKGEMDEETYQLLEGMADAVDLRDPYTGGHSRRVAELVGSVLEEMSVHGQEAVLVRTAARLHDIGKIDLPDHISINTGDLTSEEQALISSYPQRGVDLLDRYPDFARGAEMVRHHHEHWDGSGYPQQLSGVEIPFGARVIAVADSFDAMTNDRPYRRALSTDRAAAILYQGRGRQWDPDVVDAFLRSISYRLERPVEELPQRRPVETVGSRLSKAVSA